MGASFTGFTVRINELVSAKNPSDTSTEIDEEPNQSISKYAVTLRLSRFTCINTAEVSENADTVSVSPVSTSEISKPKIPSSSSFIF